MVYQVYDASDQDGQSVLLFLFTQGSTEFRYNSSVGQIVFNGQIWEPLSISCTDFAQTNEIQKDVIQITIPADSVIGLLFKTFYPERVTALTVYHGHTNDPDLDFRVAWKGKVGAAEPSGKLMILDCEPVFTSLRRPGLRARFTRVCRHLLYEFGCNVDKTAFQVNATVDDISDNGVILTIPDADSSLYPAGYFTSGMVELPTGEGVFIVNHDGDQIEIIRPFKKLIDEFNTSSSVTVLIYPGCDLTENTCLNLFNNLDNHGGFSRIPRQSPFNGSSIV